MHSFLWDQINDKFPVLEFEIDSTNKILERKYDKHHLKKHVNNLLGAQVVPISLIKKYSNVTHSKVDISNTFKENLYVKVPDYFIDWINITLPKHFDSYNFFARECGIKEGIFDSFRRRRKRVKCVYLLRILKVLSNKLTIPFCLKEILYEVSWSWNSKPIKIRDPIVCLDTKECSKFISAIFHDGSIDSTGRAYYVNTDKELCWKVCSSLFAFLGKMNLKYGGGNRIVFGKTVGGIVLGIFPQINSYRITRNYEVPSIFKNGNNSLKIEWLKQAFDDEGTVAGRFVRLKLARDMSYLPLSLRSKIISSPNEYRSFAPKLLLDIKDMVEGFGIKVNGPYFEKQSPFVYTDKMGYFRVSYQWYISISHYKNLENFLKVIGFSNSKKREKLKRIIYGIKQPHPPYKKGEEFYLKAMQNLEESIGYVSPLELARLIDRNLITIRQWFVKFRRQNFLKEADGASGKHIYNLTNYARRKLT